MAKVVKTAKDVLVETPAGWRSEKTGKVVELRAGPDQKVFANEDAARKAGIELKSAPAAKPVAKQPEPPKPAAKQPEQPEAPKAP